LERLFSEAGSVEKAAAIVKGVWKARSSRLSDIAREMPGTEAANYKYLQRFLAQAPLRSVLMRLYQEKAPSWETSP